MVFLFSFFFQLEKKKKSMRFFLGQKIMKCFAMSRKSKNLKELLCVLGEKKETCLDIISVLLPFKDFSTSFLKICSEKAEFARD